MSVPTITSISRSSGHPKGGELVLVTGTGFADAVAIQFGDIPAQVLAVVRTPDDTGADTFAAHVRTPAHTEGTVDITVTNLDEAGMPIAGETVTWPGSFTYQRAKLIAESNLTRLVRALLQKLKLQVIDNTNLRVALDYDSDTSDQTRVIAMSKLPTLVLSGPQVQENRSYSTNEAIESEVVGPDGTKVLRRAPLFTVDLSFTITAASDRTVELLNLMAIVASFLNRNRWLELDRDPSNPSAGTAKWEMDPDGEFRTQLDGPDGVGAFTCGFVVRGFDMDDGNDLEWSVAVSDLD